MITKFTEYNEKAKSFVNANDKYESTEEIDEEKVDEFIDMFNEYIKSRNGRYNTGESYVINDTINTFSSGEEDAKFLPGLNDTEFEYTVKLAKEQGWELTKKPDNYQTTSYYMTKLDDKTHQAHPFPNH